MNNNQFKGTGVAIITPFTKNGKIDFNSLEKIIHHIIKGGVDYIVVLGTTGENVTLSKDEKKEITKFVIQTTKKRTPIVLGIGGNNTMEVANTIENADLKGIDAILSVSPYYNKPNQKGLFEHYKTIASVCPLPMIIYNVPGRTGMNICAETTLKIAHEIKNVIAVKEASGSLGQCMKVIKNKPKDFLVISGDDALTLPLIASGADGVISVVANAFPKEFSSMVNFALKGNFTKALPLHYKLLDIIDLLFADGSPAGVKAALEILGLAQNNVRLPLVPVNKAVYDQLKKEIKHI